MSSPNDHSSTANYLCQNCRTINTNGNRCIQCQSEILEEIPIQTDNNQQIVLFHDFQNLFNNAYDIQSFTNMLLPMLMSEAQSHLLQPRRRRRRGRPPRRIKRITHTQTRHRYISLFDFLPFQVDINGMMPQQVLNHQFQPNMTVVQIPLQYLFFDQNGENLNPESLRQLLAEDIGTLPLTRSQISQLPTLIMSPSNLSTNPSCAICLESFDSSSEVKQLPQCHHVFHTNCLTEWLLRHGNCPICRTTINPAVQQVPNSLFNNPLIQQLFSRTIIQPSHETFSSITNPSHLPVKTIDLVDNAPTLIVSNHPSADTPQLPRFNSQTHEDSSSNIE